MLEITLVFLAIVLYINKVEAWLTAKVVMDLLKSKS